MTNKCKKIDGGFFDPTNDLVKNQRVKKGYLDYHVYKFLRYEDNIDYGRMAIIKPVNSGDDVDDTEMVRPSELVKTTLGGKRNTKKGRKSKKTKRSKKARKTRRSKK